MRSAQVDEEPVIISYRRAEPEAPPPPEPVVMPAMMPAGIPQVATIEPLPDVRISPPLLIEPALEEQMAPLPSKPSLEELQREAQEEGYEAGAQAAKAELAEELERLRKLTRAIPETLAQGIEGLEDVMVEIAFAAACKVLGQAAFAEDGVRAMVREAMREARSKEGLVLRISPRDYELFYADPARVRPIIDDAKVEVVADERVSGGCLIETGGGTLDARLEVQLRQLLDTLTRARSAPGDA